MTELVRTYKLTDSGAWGWVTEESEGGGGGSLPSWWTVDSTPGSESVEFAGVAYISPTGVPNPGLLGLGVIGARDVGSVPFYVVGLDGQVADLVSIADNPSDFNDVFRISKDGAVTISPSDAVPADYTDVLTVKDANGDRLLSGYSAGGWQVDLRDASADGLIVTDHVGIGGSLIAATPFGGGPIAFKVGPSGAVTVSPTGGAAPLTLVGLPTADPTVAGQLWNDTGTVKVSAG